MSIWAFEVRYSRRPNKSLVPRASTIVAAALDLLSSFKLSVAKFRIFIRLIGSSNRAVSSLHSLTKVSLASFPLVVRRRRLCIVSGDASLPVFRLNSASCAGSHRMDSIYFQLTWLMLPNVCHLSTFGWVGDLYTSRRCIHDDQQFPSTCLGADL